VYTQLLLVRSLTMTEGVLLITLHALMVRTGTTLPTELAYVVVSRDTPVSIVSGLRPGRVLSSVQHTDRSLDPPSVLSNWY